jgi:glycosyltransferase involved in cell wall biosynthesis
MTPRGLLPLTACILTKDSERLIHDCLTSISDICSEILVLDGDSKDRTVDICRKFQAKILILDGHDTMKFGYAHLRNYLLDNASNEWCLMIDSDEVASDQLAAKIGEIVQNNDDTPVAYRIYCEGFAFGRPVRMVSGYTGFVRLFRKSRVRFRSIVHEVADVDGRIGLIREPLYHYPFSSLEEISRKSEKYGLLEGRKLRQIGRVSYAQEIVDIVKHVSWILLYQRGILDGLSGLRVARYGVRYKIIAYATARHLQDADDDITEY